MNRPLGAPPSRSRRSRLAATALLVLTASTVTASGPTASRMAPAVESPSRPGAIIAVRTPCPWVALTFDDGPDPVLTPDALEALHEFGATATFYVIGEAVTRSPGLVARAEAEGHSIGNHTFTHENLVGRDAPAVLRELRSTEAAIRAAGATPVRELRPPRGQLDDAASSVVRESGWQVTGWNASPDALLKAKVSPEAAARRVVAPMRRGAIILLHDGGPIGRRSMTELRPLLAELRRAGLRAVPVDQLLRSAVTRRCDQAAATPVRAAPR